jgi:dihydrofolate reductase
MTKIRVHAMSMSLDGYTAGADQSVENPLGVGAGALHSWIFETRTGAAFIGQQGGTDGLDDRLMAAGFEGIGATIMGRNMFSPVRGPWGEPEWRGWWGETPPFHHPVFVLTHHARPALVMGDTTFHFVTDGIDAAVEQARVAAGERDIRLGGGTSMVRSFLERRLIDHMHLAVAPVLLGAGERIFTDGIGAVGYSVRMEPGDGAVTHYFLERD